MEIKITSPAGVKLLTEKKYCPEDITVIPELQEKAVTPSLTEQEVTPEAGYAGLGKVTIAGANVEPAVEVTAGTTDKTVTPSEGNLGIAEVTVHPTPSEEKTVTPTAAAQEILPSEGKLLSKVTVNETPTETKTIDANGTFTPSVGKFFSEVTVNVNTAKPEQEKSVTITKNGVTEVTPDTGFTLSKVTATVNVDTAKPEQTKSVDIDSMDPVTVTPDAGHVLTEVTVTPKAPLASTGDATAAAGDILAGKTAYANGAKVAGTIELADTTATPAIDAQELTPPAGTYYKKVTVAATPLDDAKTVTAGTAAQTVNPTAGNLGIKAVTVNPTPSSAKTATPTKDTQTVNPDSGKLLSSVTVNPIPDDYIIPTGTKNITENGTVDVTSFAEVNVAVPAPDLSDATATPDKVLLNFTAYTGAGKIIGTIPTYDGSLRPDSEMPIKGDLITIENKQYRVLKINKTVAEVLAMYDSTTSQKFDARSSGYNNTYANNSLDVYLSQTFYNSLSTAMQNAIVAKTLQQDSWQWNGGSSAIANYAGTYQTTNNYTLSLMSTTFGSSISRKCYVLSCQDVIDYLGVTTSMGSADTTLTSENVWKMFWNQTTSPGSTYPWLRSANAAYSSSAFAVYGAYGSLSGNYVDYSSAVRPAFQIDLSKIEFTK